MRSILKKQIIRLILPSGEGISLTPTPGVMDALMAEQTAIKAELNAMQNRQELANELAQAIIQHLMIVNQYINFRQHEIRCLERLFLSLLQQLAAFYDQKEQTPEGLARIFRQHGLKVGRFLLETNGSHLQMLKNDQLVVHRVPCAEYEAPFQFELLGIEMDQLQEPVLDLGSGTQARLVQALRERGLEAYGLERMEPGDNPFIYVANWLDFYFAPDKWGTVISNMAFSNHFWHHHLRKDGDYTTYAQKYMEILRSLQVGGSFIYAPGLPFIEPLLEENSDTYTVCYRKLDQPSLESNTQEEDMHPSRWYVAQVVRKR